MFAGVDRGCARSRTSRRFGLGGTHSLRYEAGRAHQPADGQREFLGLRVQRVQR